MVTRSCEWQGFADAPFFYGRVAGWSLTLTARSLMENRLQS